jgi:hypothetical protein
MVATSAEVLSSGLPGTEAIAETDTDALVTSSRAWFDRMYRVWTHSHVCRAL